MRQNPAQNTGGSRVHVYDVVRGFSVISMVLFHLCYDLKFILGMNLGWFAPPFQDIWRASISWVFVFVAGCMYAYSRDNLRRSAKYLLVALVIYVATTVTSVDDPINFGIIYCMGACTLTTWAMDRMGIRLRGPIAGTVCAVLFVLFLPLASGHLGIGGLVVDVPPVLYSTPWLNWLGLPGPGFISADYYPLLPYLLLYLVGANIGTHWKESGMPAVLQNVAFEPLEIVGRLALPIYVLHQPVLLLLLGAF